MKTISYDGVAAATDDEIADAVLDLAISVARYSRYEQVTFPVLIGGAEEELTLMLGPTIHISALTIGSSRATGVEGGAQAAARIRARTKALNDPLHAVEDGSRASTAQRS
jgi:hypothetical protein